MYRIQVPSTLQKIKPTMKKTGEKKAPKLSLFYAPSDVQNQQIFVHLQSPHISHKKTFISLKLFSDTEPLKGLWS